MDQTKVFLVVKPIPDYRPLKLIKHEKPPMKLTYCSFAVQLDFSIWSSHNHRHPLSVTENEDNIQPFLPEEREKIKSVHL